MSNLKTFLRELRITAWRTEGARFNAARRFKRRDWFATLSIAIFSSAGIGVTLIQKIYGIQTETPLDKYLTALSVCLGLFVIVTSLIEWGGNGAVKAEALFQNAQELSSFQRKLGQRLAETEDNNSLSTEEVTNYREEYEQIKLRCAYNHEPIDDSLFLSQHRFAPEFISTHSKCRLFNWFKAKRNELQSYVSVIWYYGLFWLIIASLIWKSSTLATC
ncbi:hypothetical protein SAMN02949497_4208 [Methylomagnum ishizawai]|uniref:SMODS and SLOG-associating 2TM effector domain-containing protein n=1 Tax=Methylomagnum ishizawai TaxID=1760988 RepID=A0A1Y6D1I7_9GAMM|nr:SLATT domain-containing protein [Methylomagnum ishizawai]SMF96799.1 hypothetical protein SAMN02949497_4208 [Methylomagnum ishizawai]